MARRVTVIALTLALATALSGCASVVARVNGQNITQKEFYEQLERAQGLQTLQQLVLRKLIEEKAAAEKCLPTEQEVSQRFAKFKQERFNNDEQELRKWMKANAVDDKSVLDQIKFELTTFKLRTRKVKPTEENLKTYFTENREKYFDKPARVSFRQIVVPNKQAADQIIAKLNNEGSMFQEIARQVSMDEGSKNNGGLYEDVPVEIITKQAAPVAAALKTLQPNQITQQAVAVGPNAQQQNFVILKLLGTKPAETAKFEDPKTHDEVKERYLQENAEPEQELLAEVTKGAEVVILKDPYKAAIEPFFTGQAQGGAPGQAGGQGNLPAGLEKQLQKKPDMTGPTDIDEKAMPKTTLPGGG